MKNLTFHIVGLTHNDVKGHEVEYAKEAEGRTICLVPDDANTFDMLAVKAYDKQQLIGYVSALEGEDVRALIIARKERNLRTRCIGCNSKNEGDKAGLQLMVRALSDVSDEEMEQARREIYDDKIYDDWQYSGPVLPIEQLTGQQAVHRTLFWDGHAVALPSLHPAPGKAEATAVIRHCQPEAFGYPIPVFIEEMT